MQVSIYTDDGGVVGSFRTSGNATADAVENKDVITALKEALKQSQVAGESPNREA